MKIAFFLYVVVALLSVPVYYIYKFYEGFLPTPLAGAAAVAIVSLYVSLLIIAYTSKPEYHSHCVKVGVSALVFEMLVSVFYLTNIEFAGYFGPKGVVALKLISVVLHGPTIPVILFQYIELLLKVIMKQPPNAWNNEAGMAAYGIKVVTMPEDTREWNCPNCGTPLSVGLYRQAKALNYCKHCKPSPQIEDTGAVKPGSKRVKKGN